MDLDATRERYLLTLTLKDRAYARDPWLWFSEQVVTVDESRNVVSPWPTDKLYTRDLVQAIHDNRLIAIPKSRRMMASWTVSTYAVWAARYTPHWAGFIQSRSEEAAAFLVDKRCSFVEDRLRDSILRKPYDSLRTKAGLIGKMTYKDTDSWIQAIAQGAEKIRAYTASFVFMDECEFQEEASQALVAALPLVEHGARLVLASSSNGPSGVLAGLCRDVGFTRFK